MGFLSYDSPIMRFLGRMADLVVLNLLTMLFSIPIITAGAATTAAHYTALKIRRGEGYVWRSFWKSFKENLKQSTGIWLIYLLHMICAIFALSILRQMEGTMATIMQGIIMGALILSAFVYVWIFPLQSKFVNTIKGTAKNALYMSIKYLFRTFYMILLNILPIVVTVVVVLYSFQWFSIILLFGCSLPTYLCAIAYDKVFEKLEEMVMEQQKGGAEQND